MIHASEIREFNRNQQRIKLAYAAQPLESAAPDTASARAGDGHRKPPRTAPCAT